jgi:hypothetical protein
MVHKQRRSVLSKVHDRGRLIRAARMRRCLIIIIIIMIGGPGSSLLAAEAGTAADGSREHWALRPLVTPPVPPGAAHPIDAFIREKLDAHALRASEDADRATLIRRVYFDLIGLPPTPAEVDAFLGDAAPEAFERVVDRLLASPRYGERWARHWIDVAHFAETHGHDQDRIRPNAWPYRDYLIRSLNEDKPYGRFIEEQIAGDALFPDDAQATIALGFLAAGPWDESSLRDIREDTLDRQIGRSLDRDDIVTTVMSTFASSTVHCARCHDHKFDPIPQRDYYALQAVFAGVDRANREYDADPAVHQRRIALRQEKEALERNDRALLAALTAPAVENEIARWESEQAVRRERWQILKPIAALSAEGAILEVRSDNSIVSTGPLPDRDTYTIRAECALPRITAVRLEVLDDESLPARGPGRRVNGNFHLSEFAVHLENSGDRGGPKNALLFAEATADFNQTDWPITRALDGDEKTAWGIYPAVGKPHEAIFALAEPREVPAGSVLVLTLKQLHGAGHLIGCARVAVTDVALPVRVERAPGAIAAILEVPRGARTEEQQRLVAAHWRSRQIERALAELPAPQFVYAAAAHFIPDGAHVPPKEPRPVHVLNRGDIRKPGELAKPGALSCVAELPASFSLPEHADESERRIALARWLTDPRNPLTWRSIVNRIWQHHFGRGIVETPNDFGKMGGAPSHPELLDWLAVWFRDHGGSWKQLHRLIVTSATFRQTVAAMDQSRAHAIDADNRWLSHMNRTRLDAESIHDAILEISGQLDLRMGGPSDQQFELKPGRHVTPLVDYAKFDVDSAAGRRRSIYRFLFRTLPDPFMEALDCPAGDQLTAVRNQSITPQQAMALWNSAFVAGQSEHWAARLAAEAPGDIDGQIKLAFALALGRSPGPAELEQFSVFAHAHGLANLCRVIFNSNEFIFVN